MSIFSVRIHIIGLNLPDSTMSSTKYKSFARLFKGGGVEGCGCPVDTSAEGARRKCPWGTEAPTEPGGETGAPHRVWGRDPIRLMKGS